MNYKAEITAFLQRTGWSIHKLAQRAGITPSNLYRWLNGQSESMHLRNIEKVMQVISAN